MKKMDLETKFVYDEDFGNYAEKTKKKCSFFLDGT